MIVMVMIIASSVVLVNIGMVMTMIVLILETICARYPSQFPSR